MIGWMARPFVFRGIRPVSLIVHVLQLEVLHLGWAGNTVTECIADLQMKFLLEYRAQCIEVPIVVKPKRAGRMRSARRHVLPHRRGPCYVRMVNSGTGLKEHSHGGLLLLLT